ncbi:hypothetical protein SBRCBS47491_007709 [Sporothrix bragantina]|uniref:Transcription factor domain-containing protein n=1 Tax=Sporothrix bragantina TaxID=671064 RepID=A0ABP0CFW5_9PEZI
MDMQYGFGGFSFSGLGTMDMSIPAPVPTSLAPAMPVSMPMPSPFGLHMPYAAPPDPVLETMDCPVASKTSPELRRLITSMVRTFPRISHAFVSRSPHSDEFLWRAIDKEQQAIMERLHSLSFGEIFASIQAVSIYTTMRLIVYGREYFFADMSLLDTMSKLSQRFHELWRGPFMPVHDDDDDDIDLAHSSRPAWEDWIFDETRRRITATCWLMSLAVNARAQSFRLSKPQRFPLPSSRRLWEAGSRASWERAYDNDRIERYALRGDTHGTTPRLGTVGDLARAIDRSVAAEGKMGQPNTDALFEDDLLAHWHAGVDSLGMMITTAAAQYTFD